MGNLPLGWWKMAWAKSLGSIPAFVHHPLRRVHGVAEVGRLAGETAAVPRVVHVLAAPEIGRVGGPRVAVDDLGEDHVLIGAEDEGGGAGGRRVLEGVAGGALRGVGADPDRVFDLAGLDQRLGDEEALGARLAGELEIGHVERRDRADGLGDDGARGFDRVGVRLGTDVEGADLGGVDPARAGESVARRLHRHGDGVLIGAGHRFFEELETALVGGSVGSPHLGDLLELDAASRDEGAVTDDANRHRTSWALVLKDATRCRSSLP